MSVKPTRESANEKWYALEVILTPEAREAVEYGLMEAGAGGTETITERNGELCVIAYFDAPPERALVRAALHEALRIYSLPSGAVGEMRMRKVEGRDWLAEWKKNWQPVSVGERFIIAPPWSATSAAPEQIVIRIEPGMAFGTGTHETTRLCLAAIEKHFRGGSFLDVGTGTGILAIAAAKLFPGIDIEACDTDPEAIVIARENARLNSVSEGIRFFVGTVDETLRSADCVCANLTADIILPLLPALVGATCGRLILSGILDAQASVVRAGLRELGIEEGEITTDGEWIAVVV